MPSTCAQISHVSCISQDHTLSNAQSWQNQPEYPRVIDMQKDTIFARTSTTPKSLNLYQRFGLGVRSIPHQPGSRSSASFVQKRDMSAPFFVIKYGWSGLFSRYRMHMHSGVPSQSPLIPFSHRQSQVLGPVSLSALEDLSFEDLGWDLFFAASFTVGFGNLRPGGRWIIGGDSSN